MTDNVQALVDAVKTNDELRAKIKSIQEGLTDAAKEYIDLAAENGITLELKDFDNGNVKAIQELIEVEKGNPVLEEHATALEEQLQVAVDDIIALAQEHGLTLTREDFDPNA